MPGDSLTFADAMALDPAEVETYYRECWVPLKTRMHDELGMLRACEFRRARPKRSRAQEMAASGEGAFDVHAKERAEHYEEAIRAVCEYARNVGIVDSADAVDIERHFLEVR